MEFLFDKSANSDFDLILFAFNQLVSLIRQKRCLRPKEREEFSFISTMLSNLYEENLYRNQDYYRKKIHEDSRLQINEEVIHISTPPGPLIAKLIANPETILNKYIKLDKDNKIIRLEDELKLRIQIKELLDLKKYMHLLFLISHW